MEQLSTWRSKISARILGEEKSVLEYFVKKISASVLREEKSVLGEEKSVLEYLVKKNQC